MSANIDVVVDVQYGDSGKGAVTHALSARYPYDFCLRFNGGANAGHTIYHKGEKVITHLVPSGIVNGVTALIGPGTVVHVPSFLKELETLEKAGIPVKDKVYIAHGAHIVTDAHIASEGAETAIGTTRRGIGPCIADKVARKGLRAEDVAELAPYLFDMSSLTTKGQNIWILAEGAQGFGLDIDLGDYPYVTSTNCGPGAVVNNGFCCRDIQRVYGVGKVYETYVGAKSFHGENPVWDEVREAGKEYGATTGRPRQCNQLNLDRLILAVNTYGVNFLNLRKLDVLEAVGHFSLSYKGRTITFDSKIDFMGFIESEISNQTESFRIIWSSSPEGL